MDQETLFTSAKWNILKALSQEKRSPLELAKLANTSMSNISQSLRFLELANIVKSERVSNRDKGQPRVVYSLSQDNAYLIVTSEGFVEKKLIQINEHKKTLIRIWLYSDESKREKIEQAYLDLKNSLDQIKGLFVEENTDLVLRVIYHDKNSQTAHLNNVELKSITEQELQNEPENYYPIYDPQKISSRMIT